MKLMFLLISAGLAFWASHMYRQQSALWALPVAVVAGLTAVILLPLTFGPYAALLLLVAPLGYGVYRHQQGDVPWAKPLVGICASLIMVLALIRMAYSFMGCADDQLLAQTRQQSAQVVAIDPGMRQLGQRLAERHAYRQVLAVYTHLDTADAQADVASLRAGMGSKMTGVTGAVIGAVPPAPPAVSYQDFDGALASHPGTGLLVSFVRLPDNYERMGLLKLSGSDRVPLVLLNYKPGTLRERYLRDGQVAAVLVMMPAEIPEALMSAIVPFRLVEHVLVDASNLDAAIAAFPHWFLK